jgi:hypothetical protein
VTIYVWVDNWQLVEKNANISVGDSVTWDLSAMDPKWATLLFGRPVSFDLQLDAYAAFTSVVPPVSTAGTVSRIDAVWCAQERDASGAIVPRAGAGRLEFTESSTLTARTLPARSNPDRGDEYLYGFRVTLVVEN